MTLFKRRPKPVAPHSHQWDTDRGYSVGLYKGVPLMTIRCTVPGCRVQMLVEGGVK